MIRIEADLSNFLRRIEGAEAKVREAIPLFLAEAGGIASSEMRTIARSRTGFLADSIVVKSSGSYVKIGPTARYAPFVELGTRPHLIFAEKGRVLTFRSGGSTIFARRVSHPGTKGVFFVRRTAEAVKERIQSLAGKIIGEAVRG